MESAGVVKGSSIWRYDSFGWSVALNADGNTLAVGTPKAHSEEGEVYIFRRVTIKSPRVGGSLVPNFGTAMFWTEQAIILATNPDDDDQFGYSLTLSADGNTLAVAAPYEDSMALANEPSYQSDNSASSSGAVYVLNRAGSTWNAGTYIKATNTQANDLFGLGVALSADGNTLAVGGPGENGAGTVYLY